MKQSKNFKVLVMIVLFFFIFATTLPYTAIAADPDSRDITAFVYTYMDSRKELLSTGNTAALASVANAGIVNDELAHREYLCSNSITLPDTTIQILDIEVLDGGAVVNVRELQTNITQDSTIYDVSHVLTIMYGANTEITAISDGYFEEFSGFRSCSYVDPDIELDADINAMSRRSCFLHIALQEVGYLEKASDSQLDSHTANPGNADYSKYGAWYGASKMPWCAAFVSWCADRADVSTSIIPLTALAPDFYTFYSSNGRYYSRETNGSYVPSPGDIFIMSWEGKPLSHAGIVYSVSGSYMTVIDGNWGERVNYRTMSLTDSSLNGFCSPNYTGIDHAWTQQGTISRCLVCGKTSSSSSGTV